MAQAISSFPFFWLYFIIRIYEYENKVKLFFLFTASAYRYEIYVRISPIMSTNCRTFSLSVIPKCVIACGNLSKIITFLQRISYIISLLYLIYDTLFRASSSSICFIYILLVKRKILWQSHFFFSLLFYFTLLFVYMSTTLK